jgi:hypothetical protein
MLLSSSIVLREQDITSEPNAAMVSKVHGSPLARSVPPETGQGHAA